VDADGGVLPAERDQRDEEQREPFGQFHDAVSGHVTIAASQDEGGQDCDPIPEPEYQDHPAGPFISIG
jgi:hypothetical protein